MIKWLRDLGISPDLAYGAALLSIGLSIAMWLIPRDDAGDEGRPERLAIFVGLWAPTLALLGHALREEEKPV